MTAAQHESVRSDFYEIVRQFVGAATAAVVADRLVHVVVLHGLLPELDEKPAPPVPAKTSYLADLEMSADMAGGGRPVLQLDEHDAEVYAEAFRLAEATDRFIKLWTEIGFLVEAMPAGGRRDAFRDLQVANGRMMGARVSRVGAARMRAPR